MSDRMTDERLAEIERRMPDDSGMGYERELLQALKVERELVSELDQRIKYLCGEEIVDFKKQHHAVKPREHTDVEVD